MSDDITNAFIKTLRDKISEQAESGDEASLFPTDIYNDFIVNDVVYENYCQVAAQNGALDIVQYFVERGVDFSADSELAFRWACENGHLDVVRYLIMQDRVSLVMSLIEPSGQPGTDNVVEELIHIEALDSLAEIFKLPVFNVADLNKFLVTRGQMAATSFDKDLRELITTVTGGKSSDPISLKR